MLTLKQIHEYELARADLLGEAPLPPERLLELAEHMERLADADPEWADRLVAQADAAAERPTRHAPHMGASRVL